MIWRWPWTRTEKEQIDESKAAEDVRVSLHVQIGRLEQVVDRLENIVEDQGGITPGRG